MDSILGFLSSSSVHWRSITLVNEANSVFQSVCWPEQVGCMMGHMFHIRTEVSLLPSHYALSLPKGAVQFLGLLLNHCNPVAHGVLNRVKDLCSLCVTAFACPMMSPQVCSLDLVTFEKSDLMGIRPQRWRGCFLMVGGKHLVVAYLLHLSLLWGSIWSMTLLTCNANGPIACLELYYSPPIFCNGNVLYHEH